MQSRLDELRTANTLDAKKAGEVRIEMVDLSAGIAGDTAHLGDAFAAFASINVAIGKIENHLETIHALERQSKQEVKEEAHRRIMENLDRTMIAAKREVRFIKAELDKMSSENARYLANNPGATSGQMKKNLLNTHARHFQVTVQAYQQV